jgi:predicted ATPase/DNA-binding XRE family transcriptional regulator
MTAGAPESFGAHLKALREAAGFTQDELATIAGLSVHAVSALERGERRRPRVETLRALSAALDLTGATLQAFLDRSRTPRDATAADELSGGWLPLPPTALLGRDAEMATLREWLSDGASRLVTVVGPGGVGKTRLVLEVARAAAEEPGTRVVFLCLAAIAEAGLVGPAIAEAFGLTDLSAADLGKRLRVACGAQPTVLVLDNFEHVLDAAPLVVDLLKTVAPLRLVVTSRAPLRVRGERECAIGPLAVEPGSEAPSLADLARVPAVRLFAERVRDVHPDFRLTPANAPTVAAICRRLDGLPLALELTAPWIKVLTPEDLLGRLMADVLLAAPGPRDLPERQRTLNATVAWSYQLLDAGEQRAFRWLGVLPGLFRAETVAAILGGPSGGGAGSEDAIRVVAHLIDKSLLLRAELPSGATRPMYQMLDTVRAFAARELTAAGERDEAFEGLARYCSEEAVRATAGLVGLAQPEWLDRVREDLDSYRAALAWLIARGRTVEASDIACGLLTFWVIRGYVVEGLDWYQRILAGPPLPAAVESRTRIAAGLTCYAQGRLEPARAAIERGLSLAPDGSDMLAVGGIVLGYVESAAGRLTGARDRFTQSLDAFRALAVPWGIGNALTGLAELAIQTGDADQAERLLDEAASALRQAGPLYLCLALCARGVLAVQRGDADHAMALVRESLPRIRELHDKFAFVRAMVVLSAAVALTGDHAWAARVIGVQDVVAERTGAVVVGQLGTLRDGTEAAARARLGREAWAEAYAAGRTASIDALMRDIDRARSGREYSGPGRGSGVT